jgi:hypothetical protein
MRVTLCAFMILAGTASFQAFGTHVETFGSEADKQCWKLPEGSGYLWKWVFDVDSGYCVGIVAKTYEEAFKIGIGRVYGVMPPGMIELETSFVKTGSVSGTPVRWYRASRPRSTEQLEYRTFTLVDERNERYLAVSVYAATESEMNDRLGVLERLKYR